MKCPNCSYDIQKHINDQLTEAGNQLSDVKEIRATFKKLHNKIDALERTVDLMRHRLNGEKLKYLTSDDFSKMGVNHEM